jgi:nucleotide-binding universal stress UspA family protein
MYKKILMAYNGSLAGRRALLDCHELAQWNEAELTLLAVAPLPLCILGPEASAYDTNLLEVDQGCYHETLNAGVSELAGAGLRVQGLVVTGDPVLEISRYASRIKADLIVVGHRHLAGRAVRWWGHSVSKYLIQFSPCNVLVVVTP